MIEAASHFREQIVAIGLATSEVGLPIKKFQKAFLRAKELGFKTCSHFWDMGASSNISDGLRLCKLDRIDHGMSVIDDLVLLETCISMHTPFTLCPQSLITFDQMKLPEAFPLKALLERGLNISVNSDDAAYNRAYIGDSFALVAKLYDLKESHIKQLCENSFKQAFISDSDRKKYLSLVSAFFTR